MSEKKYIRVERYKWPDEIEAEKKETRRRFKSFLLCALCLALGISIGAVAFKTVETVNNSSQSKLSTIYEIMEEEWYFGKDIENLDTYLLNNAIYGLTTNEYDIHTNYMDEERASEYLAKLEGSVVGIGITMTIVEDIPLITRVFASSPAENAGLKQGDIIHKIDGMSVKGKTLDEIADLTKGKAGTKVTYEVLRDNKSMVMEMTRESVNTTAYGYRKNDVAVLDIESISENTDQEVEFYLMKFKNENVNRIVLDLRGNTGGYVSTVINICSLFMDKGKTVFYESDKDGNVSEYKTKKSNVYTFDKIIILVDENTASAAEVMATCLREQVNATLVGVTTYGKGTVQVSHQFNDGSYIKYTIAEWLTAEKEKINKVGVSPDVVSALHPVLSHSIKKSSDVCKIDSVNALVKDAQLCLDFLGYDVDRMDGYYSQATLNALHAFQKDYGLTISEEIDYALVEKLVGKINYKWITEQETLDTQLLDAIEEASK